MLCSRQMATKAQVTAEQYLHMTFDYDAEFVRGEIVERATSGIWGVPDSQPQRTSVPTNAGLQTVSSLTLPDYSFELAPAALFSDL